MSETSAAPAAAAISIRQTLANSKWVGAEDPKTKKPIAVGDQVVLCPKCYTPQLLTSWRENDNKCAIDGTPARVIDPYRYALPVNAPTESSVWRGNIMTIVTLLVLWGLVVLVYSLLVAFNLLPVPGAA